MGLFGGSGSSDSGGQPPILTLILVAAGVGGLFIVDRRLSSLRPTVSPSGGAATFEQEDVPARLWEDPLLAVDRFVRERGGLEKVEGHEVSVLRERKDEFAPTAARPLVVLPVFVSGGNYAEDIENRRRQRFAVVSALGRAGLVPDNDESIGFVRTRWKRTREEPRPRWTHPKSGAAKDDPGTISFRVPYEWFKYDGEVLQRQFFEGREIPKSAEKAAALVLWVEEGFLEPDPIGMLEQLIEEIVRGDELESVEIPVIGPASSTGLIHAMNSSERGDDALLRAFFEHWFKREGYDVVRVRRALAGVEVPPVSVLQPGSLDRVRFAWRTLTRAAGAGPDARAELGDLEGVDQAIERARQGVVDSRTGGEEDWLFEELDFLDEELEELERYLEDRRECLADADRELETMEEKLHAIPDPDAEERPEYAAEYAALHEVEEYRAYVLDELDDLELELEVRGERRDQLIRELDDLAAAEPGGGEGASEGLAGLELNRAAIVLLDEVDEVKQRLRACVDPEPGEPEGSAGDGSGEEPERILREEDEQDFTAFLDSLVKDWIEYVFFSRLVYAEGSLEARASCWALFLGENTRRLDEPLTEEEREELERSFVQHYLDHPWGVEASELSMLSPEFVEATAGLAPKIDELFEGWGEDGATPTETLHTMTAAQIAMGTQYPKDPAALVRSLRAYLDAPEALRSAKTAATIQERAGDLLEDQAFMRAGFDQKIRGIAEVLREELPDVEDRDPDWAEHCAGAWLGVKGLTVRERMQFFSTRATVADRHLGRPDDQTAAKRITELITGIEAEQSRFVSTIVRDDDMVGALVGELERRGLRLDGRDHVALVGEWDTLYGRAFPETMRRALVTQAHDCAGDPETFDVEGLCEEESCRAAQLEWALRGSVREVSYLRGLDGAIPGEKTESQRAAEAPGRKSDEWSAFEQPTGRSQLDYVRRLEAELLELRRRLLRDDGRLFAIGVVGTDVYDKQMILQALRGDFPGTLFFTTDLDARLVHASQYHWSRNLIIASPYDLELTERIQGRFPPFRDSYQTSTYLACLLALWGEVDLAGGVRVTREDIDRHARARLFEVGRGGAYAITEDLGEVRGALELDPDELAVAAVSGGADGWNVVHAGGGHAPAERAELVHPDRLSGFRAGREWLSVLALGLIVTFLNFFRPRRRTASEESVQPDVWLGWTFGKEIQLGVVFVVLGLLGVYLLAVIDARTGAGEPFELFRGVSAWPTIMLRAVMCGIGAAMLLRMRNQVAASNALFKERLGMSETRQHQARGEGKDGSTVWAEYMRRGSRKRRLMRVVPLAALFLVVSLALVESTGLSAPVRGALATGVEVWSFRLSLAILVLITFHAIDSAHLCEGFMRAIADVHTTWSDRTRRVCSKRTGIPDTGEDFDEFLDVEIVARRTEVVERYVIWPFALFLILILSRNKFFDDWSWPWSLFVVYGVLLAGLLYSAWRLRYSAERVRSGALARLTRLAARREETGDPAGTRSITDLSGRIEKITAGVFAPWSQRPAVRGFLLPFGGVGAIAALDLLAKFGL
jgi:signal transduction histidine kinase